MKIFYFIVSIFFCWHLSSFSLYAGENHAHQPDEHVHDDAAAHKNDKDHDNEISHNHDEDEGNDDHHEVEQTVIEDKIAREVGITTAKAGPRAIQETLSLTGRIILNRNSTAYVRARFPGIIQNVLVNWGDTVKKGQILASIELNQSLKSYPVTAPIDGVIIERNTHIGDVTREDPLFVIADLSEVWAELHVFPRNIKTIKKDQVVQIQTFENQGMREGKITYIQPIADTRSQTMLVIVPIQNIDPQWLPGMMIEGKVIIAETKVSIAVSQSAIQYIENKPVVFVKQGETYIARNVSLGRHNESLVEILLGLNSGEEYVENASFIIKSDMGKHDANHDHGH